MRREAEFDQVDAVTTGAHPLTGRQGQRGGIVLVSHLDADDDREFGIGHRQSGQLGGDLLGQPLGRLGPRLAELGRRLRDFMLQLAGTALQRCQTFLGHVECGQPGA